MRLRRDYGSRHCDLVILVPWRPNGPPHLEEMSIEVLDTQRLTRCRQHFFHVVPVDRPAVRLGCTGQSLAVHHPVGKVVCTVVPDSLGNCGWKLLALAKCYTKDTRHRYRDGFQGKHGV